MILIQERSWSGMKCLGFTRTPRAVDDSGLCELPLGTILRTWAVIVLAYAFSHRLEVGKSLWIERHRKLILTVLRHWQEE